MNNIYEDLIEFTKKQREKAYTPYSNFKVGAAILFNDGSIVGGCNVENISYGLTNCAERTAIFTAVAAGKNLKDARAFCVIGSTKDPISPCGACRQVMAEFFDPNLEVILANLQGKYEVTTVAKLLPYSFKEIENVL